MTLPSTSAQNQQQAQQSQHFLLKWNNHRTNLVNVFEHLLQHENLVDVTLAVEGKFLKAHKIVLSACSPYFQTMFVQQTPEEKHPILIFHDLKHAHMKTLLEFMYRGEISIDERDLSDVLKIAEALSIRGLSSFESDEEDSMSDVSPGSPQSSVNVTIPTASSAGTSSSNTNSSNVTSTNFQQQDFYHASQSSTNSSASSSSNISQSQLSLDNQNSHQSKVSGGKATSSCDSKNTSSGNNVNGNKNQVNAKGVKKEKVKKVSTSTATASTASASSVGSATAAAFSSIVSGLIMNKANSNSIGKASQTQVEAPIKKKRGRKPLNKNKPEEKNGISTSVNSVVSTSKDIAGKTSKISKPQHGKATAMQQEVHIPSRAEMAAVKLKPVRRRIPKRLAETLQRSQVKRERLSASGDLKNHSDADDDFNGSLESLISSEPLSEMSVRGLDLFKYAAIEDGVYRCMECEKLQIPKTFKNKYSFQRHAFLYHEGNMRKVFPCPVCFREFSRPDKMKNHLRSVHESGGNGGGGGGGKSASSPTPGDFTATSAFGLGPRMNEHCDF